MEIDQELREIFISEANDLLDVMENGLLALEDNPQDSERLNEVFRAAHTIKGNAQLMELDKVAVFAHTFEEVLDRLRDGELTADSDLISLMLTARDALKEMIQGEGESRTSAQVDELASRLGAVLSGNGDSQDQKAAMAGEEPEQDSAATGAGGRILVIHHVSVIRQLISRYLHMTDLGEAAVDVAVDGHQGVERLSQERYDVVLCGLEIAGLNGVEVFEQLLRSSQNRDTPFVIITSTDSANNRARLEAAGIEHVLVAPFSPSQLMEKVSKVFAPRRRRSSPRYAVVDTQADIDLGGVVISGKVVNLSNEGLLCQLTYPGPAVNLMLPCSISIDFSNRYGGMVLSGLASRPVKQYVLTWREDNWPHEIQAAWQFIDPPAQATKALDGVLEHAKKDLEAANARGR